MNSSLATTPTLDSDQRSVRIPAVTPSLRSGFHTRDPLVKHPTRDRSAASSPSTYSGTSTHFRHARKRERLKPLVPWTYIIASACMVVFGFFLWLRQDAEMVTLQYRLVHIRSLDTRLLNERTVLKLHVQDLTALGRIYRLSRNQLGMVRPAYRRVLDLGAMRLTRRTPRHPARLARSNPFDEGDLP